MPNVPRPPGPLKLGPRLAVGGMGEVFRATLEVGGRELGCVVKTLLPGVGETERALFLREARALAALTRLPARRFAHLIGVDGGDEASVERLVVELVDGADLATVLAYRKKRGRPLPVVAVVALGVALAEALVELGAAEEDGRKLGLVHRDLHPGNVVVGRDGAVKVIDLGVSTMSALEATSANPRGTLGYMAPEQLREGRVSAASDVYAVGLMLWEALVGEPARPAGDGALGELLAYRQTVPEGVRQRRPGGAAVPEALEAWVSRALAVEAEARPSATELLEGLWGVAAGLGVEAAALEAALAAVVEPLVEVAPVRAAPTLGGAGGVGGAAVRGAVVEPAEVAPVGVVAGDESRASGGGGAGGQPEARPRRVRWLAGGALLVAVVGVVIWVVVGFSGGGSGAASGAELAAGAGALASSGGAALADGSGASASSGGAGRADGSGASVSLGGSAPADGSSSTAVDSAVGGGMAGDAVAAAPTPGLVSGPGAVGTAEPGSTRLDNADAGGVAGAGAGLAPLAEADAKDTLGGGEPRSTVLDNAQRGGAGEKAAPRAVTVSSLDGPLHVSGLGVQDLAPKTTSPLELSASGLLRLTGGTPPLIALVRVAHQDSGLAATVGAPPGEVYEVTCGGRPRPTPAAGLSIGQRLACRVTAPDGRVLGFALSPR